jgi:hypothetical protein
MRALLLTLLIAGCAASDDPNACTIAVEFPDGTTTRMGCEAPIDARSCTVGEVYADQDACARVAYGAIDASAGVRAAFTLSIDDLGASITTNPTGSVAFPAVFDADKSSAAFSNSTFQCFSSASSSKAPAGGASGYIVFGAPDHGLLYGQLGCAPAGNGSIDVYF